MYYKDTLTKVINEEELQCVNSGEFWGCFEKIKINEKSSLKEDVTKIVFRFVSSQNNAKLVAYEIVPFVQRDDIHNLKILNFKMANPRTFAKLNYSSGATFLDEAIFQEVLENIEEVNGFYDVGYMINELISQSAFMSNIFFCTNQLAERFSSISSSVSYYKGGSNKGKKNTLYLLKNLIRCGNDTLEKVYCALGDEFFGENIFSEHFTVENNKKKLKQILALPSQVLEFVKGPNAELFSGFKRLSEKRNNADLVYLVNYIQKITDLQNNHYNLKANIKRFIENVAFICEHTETSIQAVISYLVRQRFSIEQREYSAIFDIPSTESIELADYIRIAVKNGFKYEALPNNLESAHYFMSKNAKVSEDENLNADFVAAVNEYRHMVLDLDTLCKPKEKDLKGYCVVVPESTNDMAQEGHVQQHCIASYVEKVISGESKIFFIRKKKDKKTPMISFELDKKNSFVQIKEKYDVDVESPEILTLLNRWIAKQEKTESEEKGA